MIRGDIPRSQVMAWGIASVVLLVGLYAFLSHRQHAINPGDTTIPSWSQMQEGLHDAFTANGAGERWITMDTTATLGRLALGLLVGVLGALVLGVLMGCFPRMEALLMPPLAFLAKVPPTAALAVFFVMAGTGMQMYVAMIAFGILPSLAQTVHLAVKEIPDELMNKAATLGASTSEMILNVVMGIILPKVIDGVRLQIGPAVVYLIAAEMVVGDVGFGYRIRLQSRLLNMNVVYPYLVFLASFGFLVDYGLRRLQECVCPWYGKGE